MVLLLLTFCLLLLPLLESVIVLCFVVHYYMSIILMGKRELFALLNLSTWCLMVVVWLFLVVPWVCLRFVIVVFPDHTHYFSLGSYLTKLGNLDIDVILCIFWIEVACKHTVHQEVDGKKKSSRPNKPLTGPGSAVGNLFYYRCTSDCRSRDPEFDPGLVPYLCGD